MFGDLKKAILFNGHNFWVLIKLELNAENSNRMYQCLQTYININESLCMNAAVSLSCNKSWSKTWLKARTLGHKKTLSKFLIK